MERPKRILVYSEYWASWGGGEKYLLCCIETLIRSGYDVTLVAHGASLDKDALSRFYEVSIEEAKIRFVPGSLNAVRSKAQKMSAEFDVFMCITNYRFFRPGSRQTFVILQIPYGPISLSSIIRKVWTGQAREAAKDVYRIQLLRSLRQTRTVLVYSKFVHDSLERIHGVQSKILEPPIDDFAIDDIPKERIILSVGRFFRGLYNDKRYDFLIEAFKKLRERLPNTSWTYHLVGSCGSDAGSQRYLEELRASAKGHPIYFHVNSPYDELRRLYNQAEIFWHAAGHGVDEERYPERTEHFGMSTVEAMSARCVPVVVNRGGQKEIVSHGKSGYLWNTLNELLEHTTTLVHNPERRHTMRQLARERFLDFDRQHFSERLLSLFKQLDPD